MPNAPNAPAPNVPAPNVPAPNVPAPNAPARNDADDEVADILDAIPVMVTAIEMRLCTCGRCILRGPGHLEAECHSSELNSTTQWVPSGRIAFQNAKSRAIWGSLDAAAMCTNMFSSDWREMLMSLQHRGEWVSCVKIQFNQQEGPEVRHDVQSKRVLLSPGMMMIVCQTVTSDSALNSMRMRLRCKNKLLQSLYPVEILESMLSKCGNVDDDCEMPKLPWAGVEMVHSHSGVTVMFLDIVGFTTMSHMVDPYAVMQYLNAFFNKLDAMCDEYNVYKVETAGDCYIVAGGLMAAGPEGSSFDPAPDASAGAEKVWRFSVAAASTSHDIPMPHNGKPTQVRIGIHTGLTMCGLIGSKLPKFSLFGDAMNTGSRMESTCPTGGIQVSADTYDLLPAEARAYFRPTGGIEVKGVGMMFTYVHTE